MIDITLKLTWKNRLKMLLSIFRGEFTFVINADRLIKVLREHLQSDTAERSASSASGTRASLDADVGTETGKEG